jgi:hypothetical protein
MKITKNFDNKDLKSIKKSHLNSKQYYYSKLINEMSTNSYYIDSRKIVCHLSIYLLLIVF